jgi:hypothetical protein
VNSTVDGPALPKTGETIMAIPLSRASDALVSLLRNKGYRITGQVIRGVACIVVTKAK